MKKCIDCGKTTEKNEKICPECEGKLIKVKENAEKNDSNRILFFIIILCVVCVAGLLLIESFTNETTAPQQAEQTVKEDKFFFFENKLISNNINFRKMEKDAAACGAVEGYGYEFENRSVIEVYRFDTSSEIYEASLMRQQIYFPDYGIVSDVIFNGDLCLYIGERVPDKEKIIELFTSIK